MPPGLVMVALVEVVDDSSAELNEALVYSTMLDVTLAVVLAGVLWLGDLAELVDPLDVVFRYGCGSMENFDPDKELWLACSASLDAVVAELDLEDEYGTGVLSLAEVVSPV